MASNEEILKKWLDQCFEPGTLHFDTIGKIEEAMEDARKDEMDEFRKFLINKNELFLAAELKNNYTTFKQQNS